MSISDSDNTYIEVLDSTRVHPETYEWARKMAVDALEYDEVCVCVFVCLYVYDLSMHICCIHVYCAAAILSQLV